MVLIMIWLGGDLYKFSYYIGAHSPVALVACAFFQICIDLCILSQFWVYRFAKPAIIAVKIKDNDAIVFEDVAESQ